jgi:GMP reductase
MEKGMPDCCSLLSLLPCINATLFPRHSFPSLSLALSSHSLFTTVHKHYSVQDWVNFAASGEDATKALANMAVSLGSSEDDLNKVKEICDKVPQIKFLCIDVANGYAESFVEHVTKCRSVFPKHVIIAGNVVTGEMTEELALAGADIIKVGIGPGSVCTTRKMAGVGYPQLSAIIECADAAHGLGALVIADGIQFDE